MALPAQPFAQCLESQGMHVQADKHWKLWKYLETPKALLLLLAFIFTRALSSATKLEGKHPVAKLSVRKWDVQESLQAMAPSCPRGCLDRGGTLSAAWGNNSPSYQIISNLHKPFHAGSRTKAWINGISAWICYGNWPTVSRTLIIVAFYHNFLLLNLHRVCHGWPLLAHKNFFASTVTQAHPMGYGEVKAPQKPSLIPSLFCSLWTGENQDICSSHTKEDGKSAEGWQQKSKDKWHYRKMLMWQLVLMHPKK